MGDNGKAPGWSVRRVISNGHRDRWAACEGERLVVISESRADVARIVEAVNGLVEVAREHAARLADDKRRADALGRITAALRDATAEQIEALAGEIEARASQWRAP